MIKFFRRIRQKVLSENKLSKYLLYAFGEIVLVVIGILLALQINTWNTNKNEQAKEQLYLKSFYSDLEANLNELDRVIEKSGYTIGATDSLLRHVDGLLNLESESLFEELVMESGNYTILMSQEGTINDIFGSGDLALIQNDTIRKAMVNWEAGLKYIKEYETLSKDNQLSYINYLKTETPMYKFSLGQSFLDKQYISTMSKDIRFLNLVGEQKHMARVLNELYEEHKLKLQELSKVVSSAID